MVPAERASPEEVLLLVAQLFLGNRGQLARLPRPAELLFCQDDVGVAELEAFVWRCEHFPQLFFALIEPHRLPPAVKTRAAKWLVSGDHPGNVATIWTALGQLPSAMHVQQLPMRPDHSIVSIWRAQIKARIILYSGAPEPLGVGPASGKSTFIRTACEAAGRKVIPSVMHEGFTVERFVQDLRMELSASSAEAIAVHVDISAYSDVVAANTFFKNLLLCGAFFDPRSGAVVPLPDGVELHFEIGPLVGEQDAYALNAYATRAFLEKEFPNVPTASLHVGLLYPILGRMRRVQCVAHASFRRSATSINNVGSPSRIMVGSATFAVRGTTAVRAIVASSAQTSICARVASWASATLSQASHTSRMTSCSAVALAGPR